MADSPRIYGNRWKALRTLGQGGQGRVYEVEDVGQQSAQSGPSIQERMKRILREATAAVYHAESEAAMKELIQLIQELSRTASEQATRPHAALKELLPFEQAVNAATAKERLGREMAAMAAVSHPSLMAMLDSNAEQQWL